jgi:hypothetical protein
MRTHITAFSLLISHFSVGAGQLRMPVHTTAADGLRPDQKGGYWVALHREKYELPFGPDSHLLAIRIGANGEKLRHEGVQDRTGRKRSR